uniref:Uncharacterized protein n=1 Tax=Oryza punctata TaxID=4537 RepID=A0A0E0K3J0_ORYPU
MPTVVFDGGQILPLSPSPGPAGVGATNGLLLLARSCSGDSLCRCCRAVGCDDACCRFPDPPFLSSGLAGSVWKMRWGCSTVESLGVCSRRGRLSDNAVVFANVCPFPSSSCLPSGWKHFEP